MAETVYVLCLLTSAAAAFLLLRGYARVRWRILLWSGLCFVGLALNNAALIIDRVVLPDIDLSLVRLLPALIGVGLLLVGLIWDSE